MAKSGSRSARNQRSNSRKKTTLYKVGDAVREFDGETPAAVTEPYRTEFRRDFQRLLHSPSFRRLQGKTQLFPSEEHDFYRTRLTHSLEVAQIAKSIAIKLNATDGLFDNGQTSQIDLDLVEFAGLAHDLGHPPFGHNGEYVLDQLMLNYGGFEGNAQTLRILTRLEKKITTTKPYYTVFRNNYDLRRGLNLTCRTLASILKYDHQIPRTATERMARNSDKRPDKGYYSCDSEIVEFVKQSVGGTPDRFKTIECSIMDLADDIAYSTYDIEDAFAAGFLNPISILSVSDELKSSIVTSIREKIGKEYDDLDEDERGFDIDDLNVALTSVFSSVLNIPNSVFDRQWSGTDLGAYVGAEVHRASTLLSKSSYHRTHFTSDLIGRFVRSVNVYKKGADRVFWQVRPSVGEFVAIETLKAVAMNFLIRSDKFLAEKHRAKHIITNIFNVLKESGSELLPQDWKEVYDHYRDDESQRVRTVCDFISGMTNGYCVEFYERLFSVRPPSIHKP